MSEISERRFEKVDEARVTSWAGPSLAILWEVRKKKKKKEERGKKNPYRKES